MVETGVLTKRYRDKSGDRSTYIDVQDKGGDRSTHIKIQR